RRRPCAGSASAPPWPGPRRTFPPGPPRGDSRPRPARRGGRTRRPAAGPPGDPRRPPPGRPPAPGTGSVASFQPRPKTPRAAPVPNRIRTRAALFARGRKKKAHRGSEPVLSRKRLYQALLRGHAAGQVLEHPGPDLLQPARDVPGLQVGVLLA